MSIITLNLRQLMENYRPGTRITIKDPILRTCEGNYCFQGRIIPQNGTPREYCTTINSADFKRLCALRQTQTTTREVN